jgi:hypothetical protein
VPEADHRSTSSPHQWHLDLSTLVLSETYIDWRSFQPILEHYARPDPRLYCTSGGSTWDLTTLRRIEGGIGADR